MERLYMYVYIIELFPHSNEVWKNSSERHSIVLYRVLTVTIE